MPTTKKKTTTKPEGVDFHDLAEQLMGHVMQAKAKYDALDPQTKKKIVRGVAGAAATLAALGLVKKMSKKKRK